MCEEDNYLLALVRYIHLNPVRAKIVSTLQELDDYRWSGHRAIMGKGGHGWMDTGYILSQFHAREKAARKGYHGFVGEGLAMGRLPELTGGGLIRSRGGWSQVISVRGIGG